MAEKTLLILCSGLGLGNSTRLLGVVQALRSRPEGAPDRLRIVVGTNGRAVEFWREQGAAAAEEVLTLESYRPALKAPGGAIDWWGFVRPGVAGVYLENCRRISAALKRRPADLAVIDSDYHCFPLLVRGIPIVALGQARDVLRRYRLYGRAGGVPARRMVIEVLDALFQRLTAAVVLVPSFEPRDGASGKYRDVPLIVRKEFEAPIPACGTGEPLVLLSGSSLGAEELIAYARARGLLVIGPGGEPSALDAGGRPRVDGAKFVITQAGLSSISECLARRKRMLIAPMPEHGEQEMNALEVERLGVGMDFRDRASLAPDREPGWPEFPARWPAVDGAAAAAGILIERLGLKR